MSARNTNLQYRSKCAFCGKEFAHARKTAKFCPGGKCRLKAHRMKQEKGGNTWTDLTIDGQRKAMVIYNMSGIVNDFVYAFLTEKGANETEVLIEKIFIGMCSAAMSPEFFKDCIVSNGVGDPENAKS